MIFEAMSEKFLGLLRDESRIEGYAEAVARPRDTAQLGQAVEEAKQNGKQITVQGAATGVEGKGVPQGGYLISTRGMNQILGLREDGGKLYLRVQAGVTLEQAEEYLRRTINGRAYFFSPNPTEKSATLGGSHASDAKGSFGNVRSQVNSILWVEGIIAEMELILQPVPKSIWGVLLFFTPPGDAREFAQAIMQIDFAGHAHFDAQALELLRGKHELPKEANEALYLELSCDDENNLDDVLAEILELYLAHGGCEEYAWAAEGLTEMEKFRSLCHAVPELTNSELDKAGKVQPGLCKAALDRLYMSLDQI